MKNYGELNDWINGLSFSSTEEPGESVKLAHQMADLPEDALLELMGFQKESSGLAKSAYYSCGIDNDFLKEFVGTPLHAQAVAIAEADLEMKKRHLQMQQQRDMQRKQTDTYEQESQEKEMMSIQKDQLRLELHRSMAQQAQAAEVAQQAAMAQQVSPAAAPASPEPLPPEAPPEAAAAKLAMFGVPKGRVVGDSRELASYMARDRKRKGMAAGAALTLLGLGGAAAYGASKKDKKKTSGEKLAFSPGQVLKGSRSLRDVGVRAAKAAPIRLPKKPVEKAGKSLAELWSKTSSLREAVGLPFVDGSALLGQGQKHAADSGDKKRRPYGALIGGGLGAAAAGLPSAGLGYGFGALSGDPRIARKAALYYGVPPALSGGITGAMMGDAIQKHRESKKAGLRMKPEDLKRHLEMGYRETRALRAGAAKAARPKASPGQLLRAQLKATGATVGPSM
jgi:hypothetical protein